MPDVVIVGGGIIGCATAYQLAREGASVTVLERGDVSGEASGAAAGMLAALSDEGERPKLFGQLCDESLALYEPLLPVLAETGIDVRHHRIGVVNLALDEDEAQALRERYEREQKQQPLQWLEAQDVRSVEPQANPKALAGLLVPDRQYVDPQRTTQALAEAARRQGARVIEHEAVTGFVRSRNSIAAVTTAKARYEADTVVLAGGPWTMALANRLGAHIPTRPVRGQMLSLDGPQPPLRTMIWGRAYLIPREDGQTYVGATVEEVGYRKHTTAAGLASLRAGAAALVPPLAKAKQRRAWAGLRPGSPDGMPIMGRLPGWSNVWVSTGHLRNGILLAPVSGLLLARAILGESVPELAALSPSRFQE